MVNVEAKKIVKRACCIAALGGLLFGLDQGFINGSLEFISKTFGFTTSQGESFASIMLIGSIIGALSSGWISRTIGRKRTLIIAAFFFVLFSIWGAMTDTINILFFTRFCLGLAVGCASFVVPLYLSEIAPTRIRGAFISMYQLTITIGIFLIYVSNTVIGKYFQSWRLMLLAIAIPALVMFIGVLTIPRSPRWLILKGKEQDAREVLENTRETQEEVELEIKEINQSIENSKKQGGWELLRKPFFLKVIILGMLLQCLQQLSGINSVIYYSGQIFKVAGFENPGIATVVVGLVNMLTTILAVKYIDKWGRKPICYFGLTVMAITLIVAGILFKIQEGGAILGGFEKSLFLFACLAYIFAFAISLGPIIWVICAEIFPLEGRDLGMTLTTATNWIFNTIVVRFSLSVIENYGGSTLFFIFAACCILGFILIGNYTPETKGVSLELLEMNLKSGKKLKEIGQ